MSDFPQEPDWWKATDGRWYAPPATSDGAPPGESSVPSADDIEVQAEETKANTEAAGKKGCLWIVGAVVAISVLFSWCSSDDDDGDSADDLRFGAFDVCTQFVEERLKAPGSASFRNYFQDDGEVTVTGSGDGPYTVISSVDAENGFGAEIRTDFACEVRHVADGNWRLINLSLDE